MVVVTEEDLVNYWNDIKERTGQSMLSLLCITDDGDHWAFIVADASVGVPQQHMGERVLVR